MSDVNWQEVETVASVLRDAATMLDKEVGAGNPGFGAISDMAKVLLLLDEATQLLHDARTEVHDWVAQAMEDNDQRVDGVGDLHRQWSRSSRKDWEHETLKRDALREMRNRVPGHAVDPESGEMVHTWEQAVTALASLYNLAGYNVRIGQLKALGMHVGDYCAEEPWKASVTIHPIATPEASDG